MNKTLLIVESPSKCKKIESYLGKDYKVIASFGHFTKLNSLDQINFESYQIKYKIDKSKVLKNIKDEIKKAKEVIIATDNDREGEAIGWAICIFCKLNLKNTKKIIFQEITKTALQNALANPSTIDMNVVHSQQTRQILDIYLGYKVSPLLWKYVQHKLSAGRCQTPALKLLYDNEQLFKNQCLDTHFKIHANFHNISIKFDGSHAIENKDIESFLESHKDTTWKICDSIERNYNEKPPKVLITSSLQQKAYNTFKFSPKLTMKYAQELYENGLITYMRTDSACYSKEFIDKLHNHINTEFGEKYISKNIQSLCVNKNKNKSQEAHEGIRICDLKLSQSNVKTPQANKLYQMIYNHSIQCGMADCVMNEIKYIIKEDNNKVQDYAYQYCDKVTIFDGWKIMNKNKEETQSFRIILNNYSETNSPINLIQLCANETIQKSPSHYNEASLVQKLEKLNIGRPSTFSSIISNLVEKKYVEKKNIPGIKMNITEYIFKNNSIKKQEKEKEMNAEKHKLQITLLGNYVCEFCYEYFNEIFDFGFTDTMETKLDEIADGNYNHCETLNEYIKHVDGLLKMTHENIDITPKQKLKEQSSLHCGNFENAPIYIKNGPYGYYVNIGKNEKISLKSFDAFDIGLKISQNINELDENEKECLINYIKESRNNKSKTTLIVLNKEYSLRQSKYGYYIYYKTSKMKKPSFLKYNDEKDGQQEERIKWVNENDVENIKSYLMKKYNINI